MPPAKEAAATSDGHVTDSQATGEAIKIKASKKIAFRPAKELKEAA